MRRVHTIHILRKVINPFMFKCAILLTFVGGVVSFVSAQNVMANMPQAFDVVALFYFSKYAFLHTEFLVQALTLGTLAIAMWLLKDIVRIFSFTPQNRVAHL